MTHPLTAAKVDRPATLAQRSAAASRNEMHTDIAGAEAPSWITRKSPNLGDETGWYIADGKGRNICVGLNQRDANLIVRAVNAYAHGQRTANAELVKAIEGAEGRIGHIADALLQDIRYGDAFISKKGASTSLNRIALELREALTKFGGSA